MHVEQRRTRTTNTWHGTREEAAELVEAIQRNCACTYDKSGVRRTLCAAHHMLVDDQRALDGLVFAKRILGSLRLEEWLNTPPSLS